MESHLENLMAHLLKWKNQVHKRTPSWIKTILNTRREIKDLQTKEPSLNDEYIESIFDETLKKAKKAAEKEMLEKVKEDKLTWDEVFKMPYILTLIFIIFLLSIFIL